MLWHIFDEDYNTIGQDVSLTFAVNSAVNALSRVPNGGRLIVAGTEGPFTPKKSLYIHIILIRGWDYQEAAA